MRDLDAAAGAALDFFLVALQDVEGAAADGADAEQADLDRFHDVELMAQRACACGSPSRKRAMRPIGLAQVVLVRQEHDAEVIRSSAS